MKKEIKTTRDIIAEFISDTVDFDYMKCQKDKWVSCESEIAFLKSFIDELGNKYIGTERLKNIIKERIMELEK